MNLKFKDNKVYLTDSKGTNIEQPFWEDTYKPFADYEDAKKWVVNYLSKNLNTSIIYFDVLLTDEEGPVIENTITINKLYKLTIKETTQQLTGSYDILITIADKDGKISELIKPIAFLDGEGTCDIIFNEPGTMEIHLDNHFKIGEQQYVFINDNTQFDFAPFALMEESQLIYIIE